MPKIAANPSTMRLGLGLPRANVAHRFIVAHYERTAGDCNQQLHIIAYIYIYTRVAELVRYEAKLQVRCQNILC